jgi:hypothetical protein
MMMQGNRSRLVLLTSVGVLSIFFFPVGQGPYPAVHGPIAGLQFLEISRQVLFRVVVAGCLSVGLHAFSALTVLFARLPWMTGSVSSVVHTGTLLRC